MSTFFPDFAIPALTGEQNPPEVSEEPQAPIEALAELPTRSVMPFWEDRAKPNPTSRGPKKMFQTSRLPDVWCSRSFKSLQRCEICEVYCFPHLVPDSSSVRVFAVRCDEHCDVCRPIAPNAEVSR